MISDEFDSLNVYLRLCSHLYLMKQILNNDVAKINTYLLINNGINYATTEAL